MIAIVVSRADSASEHIGEKLLDLADWNACQDPSRPKNEGGGTYYRTDGFELRTFEEWHLELDRPAEAFDNPDLLVFASRHSGETGALLTAHFTGNFGPAEYGGRDREFATACPAAHERVLDAFEEHAPAEYEVGMECTHHGPSSVGVPSMFVELGSGPEQWDDPDGARAVARSILDLRDAPAHQEKQLVGFGGSHYAARFERIVNETEWAVGHVGADWSLAAMDGLDPDVIEAAFERSDADHAVLDGERDRSDLETLIEELGYRVVSETWVREVGPVSLELADRLEAVLGSVEGGLRFGEPAADHDSDGEFTIESLPTEIIDAARGVNAEAVREAVETHALAFGTTENGTRVGERAAFAEAADREALVEVLIELLDREYDIEREPDAVVIRERAFDPEKAATLGIPEGPAFGKLAGGEPVEVDGRTIDPEAVQTERTRKLAYAS